MRDSEWISTLLRAGLLNASFIPEKRIREFRDLNRYRKISIRDITSQKNRVEKFLQVPVAVCLLLFLIFLVLPAETLFYI